MIEANENLRKCTKSIFERRKKLQKCFYVFKTASSKFTVISVTKSHSENITVLFSDNMHASC